MNCGYGTGLSVLEVLDAVDRVNGAPVERRIGRAPRGRSAGAGRGERGACSTRSTGARTTPTSTPSSPTRSHGSASCDDMRPRA